VVLDDPVVRAGLDQLWRNSSPDANLAQRHEQFGWIVRTATGYRIQPLGAGSFCGFDGAVSSPVEGNDAIVGFIHTHPYSIGETILACDANMQLSPAVYQGGPSDIDRVTSVNLGTQLGRSGPLPGVVIDKNGMTVYAGTQKTMDVAEPRCGY
jgi:hypothetical protein